MVLAKRLVLEEHVEPLQVSYTLPAEAMNREPLLLISMVGALFVFAITVSRLDLSIDPADVGGSGSCVEAIDMAIPSPLHRSCNDAGVVYITPDLTLDSWRDGCGVQSRGYGDLHRVFSTCCCRSLSDPGAAFAHAVPCCCP